jgi:hypothetical protein
MLRKKEDYRANLERLIEKYPNKEVLTMKEVEVFIGKDRRTILKAMRFNKIGRDYLMPIMRLARWLSQY